MLSLNHLAKTAKRLPESGSWGLQAVVFGLVAAAITNVYLTQPVLPVLQTEFGVSPSQASYTVSAVILGIALANLPFGWLADRVPVRSLILAGGVWSAPPGSAAPPLTVCPCWWRPAFCRGCLCRP